jgi:MFS family permease
MSTLLTVSIIGLWAAAVYEPTAIVFLSRQAGMAPPDAAKMASYGTGLLSIGTILGCLAAPWLAERFGRRPTLALYYAGMMVTIALALAGRSTYRLARRCRRSSRCCSSLACSEATLRSLASSCSAPRRVQPRSPSARR